MKATGCVGDAFQRMTFRLQPCPCSPSQSIPPSSQQYSVQLLLSGWRRHFRGDFWRGCACSQALGLLIAVNDHHDHYIVLIRCNDAPAAYGHLKYSSTYLTKYNPLQLSPPPPTFIFYIPCFDIDWHIPNIRGITYCPFDTLQMHRRLMIYHGGRSTKTISKPDTLTSDFKKFPCNLFDLWKCVQVHLE